MQSKNQYKYNSKIILIYNIIQNSYFKNVIRNNIKNCTWLNIKKLVSYQTTIRITVKLLKIIGMVLDQICNKI